VTTVLATWITRQLVFDGVINGLVIGLLALGIVLVFRATRVINFAVGNMGIVAAALFNLLVAQYQLPYWPAAVLSLAAGAAYGALVELVVIRRLFRAPRVIVLVATIGVAQLSLAIATAYPDVDRSGASFPQAIGQQWTFAGMSISGAQVSILLVVPLVTALLAWSLTRTTFGRSVKACASNPDLARTKGISPRRVSTTVWAVAGGLATLAMVLVAAAGGTAQNLTSIGNITLVRALAAAVIAGMASFPLAFAAALAIGVVQALVTFNFSEQIGLIDLLLFLGVLVSVYLQSRATDAAEGHVFSFTPSARPVPEVLRSVWWVRNLNRFALAVALVPAIVLPLVVTEPSRHLLYTLILAVAICAASLTVLTGWAGQLSLGQMAFAGLGAYLASSLSNGIAVDIGIGSTRFVKGGLEPIPFGISVLLAAAVTAVIAALIGIGALRVRGLLLGVSTFAFALAATQYLFDRPILRGSFVSSVPLVRSSVLGVDLTSQRSFYYCCLVVLVLVLAVLARLRRTGVGRSIIAVRDNPTTAAAWTVHPTRTKLLAFAVAGAVAGLGGAMLAAALGTVPTDRFFGVYDSLQLVSIVVIGGLGSIVGPVIGSLWVIGLPAFFPNEPLVPLLTSSIGLLALLLYAPGGLVQVAYASRDRLLRWAERRMPEAPDVARPSRGALTRSRERIAHDGSVVLAAADVVVHFGGIRAVDEASIEVRRGEIVGLIGTNGAGKSTLMNAVGGFVPSEGVVTLLGRDISAATPWDRARLGLGRTFQAASLFPELTVRETVLVAMEARARTGLVSTALLLPNAVARERRHRAAADDLLGFLGLGSLADTFVSELSTGTRRILELAGLLALEAEVLCLDEPTAGLAQRETEAFGPLLVEIQRELSASLLVIEHDMPMIMGISDRVYCLELGRVIAAGDPVDVRNDPAVVASYLGTDARAIARSGAAAPTTVN
jgi:ABC-type branched-subunit amino acid transport system ATPase component/ABC-type branched-subunit amino acid transport system permease subunit